LAELTPDFYMTTSSSDLVSARPRGHRPYALGLLVLALVQLLWAVRFHDTYAALLSVGAVPPLVLFFSLLGCLLFYTGTIRFFFHPRKGRYFFLAAAVGLGLTIFSWRPVYVWTYPWMLGAAAALLGAGLTRFLKADQ
jgi:hypothetical protein